MDSTRQATTVSALDTLGRVGLPLPARELAARSWDAIIIGAGHNGLTCAAYLARAGRRVLVLEAREQVGGANTMREVWPGVIMSPCAYLAGLLHPLVIAELGLPARGFRWTPASGGLFVPFDDGSSIQLYDDGQRCLDEVRRFAPGDVSGWLAMRDVLNRAIQKLRPAGEGDLWIGGPPTAEQLDERIGNDAEVRGLVFQWSMAEYVERYLHDERLQIAYLGQGVIGTNASPFDPGTASIRLHHSGGRINGSDGTWGYVTGGMGTVSFLLCDIARDAGAVVAAGLPVARIVPGSGQGGGPRSGPGQQATVELAGGERLHAPVVVSNADPVVTLRLLGDAADPAWRAQVESVPIRGCTVKLNLLLAELPNFTARPGADRDHFRGQINTPLTKDEWREAFAAAGRGELPERLWTELYFQSVLDRSVIRPDSPHRDAHTMSVFSQYVPYAFASGTWDSRRDEVRERVLGSIGRMCDNFPAAVIDAQVLGPPDIEREVGLTGGHIFQGECLPAHMWRHRLAYRTPMPGVFLCGACTHPGGSVIAINGRNAAMEILGG
jgi:phytoene dehydrogenase-like protein